MCENFPDHKVMAEHSMESPIQEGVSSYCRGSGRLSDQSRCAGGLHGPMSKGHNNACQRAEGVFLRSCNRPYDVEFQRVQSTRRMARAKEAAAEAEAETEQPEKGHTEDQLQAQEQQPMKGHAGASRTRRKCNPRRDMPRISQKERGQHKDPEDRCKSFERYLCCHHTGPRRFP